MIRGRAARRRTRGGRRAARRGGDVRWLTPKPHMMARSICARHSRRTSSRSAWSHRSSTVRGGPPSPSSSKGTVGERPPADSSCSALRVSCTPMSSPRYSSTWHGGPTARVDAIPEPTTLSLLGDGLLSLDSSLGAGGGLLDLTGFYALRTLSCGGAGCSETQRS